MKPLILITNDDSIDAKGIHHLVDCVKEMGEVYVVAPDEPHSGQSSAFTPNFPLRVIEHPDYNGAKVRSVTGTPVDCVKLAMHHILPRRPDLLLSGINHARWGRLSRGVCRESPQWDIRCSTTRSKQISRNAHPT